MPYRFIIRVNTLVSRVLAAFAYRIVTKKVTQPRGNVGTAQPHRRQKRNPLIAGVYDRSVLLCEFRTPTTHLILGCYPLIRTLSAYERLE